MPSTSGWGVDVAWCGRDTQCSKKKRNRKWWWVYYPTQTRQNSRQRRYRYINIFTLYPKHKLRITCAITRHAHTPCGFPGVHVLTKELICLQSSKIYSLFRDGVLLGRWWWVDWIWNESVSGGLGGRGVLIRDVPSARRSPNPDIHTATWDTTATINTTINTTIDTTTKLCSHGYIWHCTENYTELYRAKHVCRHADLATFFFFFHSCHLEVCFSHFNFLCLSPWTKLRSMTTTKPTPLSPLRYLSPFSWREDFSRFFPGRLASCYPTLLSTITVFLRITYSSLSTLCVSHCWITSIFDSVFIAVHCMAESPRCIP